MASRQEEKEARRQERLEREAAEAKRAGQKKRARLVGIGVGAVAVIGVGAVVAIGAIGGGDGEGGGDGPQTAAAGASIPAQQISDLDEAVKAAGCELKNATFEGQSHEERDFTEADYKTNPPTSGNHNPIWYEDGVYAPGDTPRLGELVHTLEHGRIDIQYTPGTPKNTVAQLETLVADNDGYHMLLFENTTKMPYAVAATAWTHMVGCKTMNPKVFDAMRTFRDEYIDKGPEKVP